MPWQDRIGPRTCVLGTCCPTFHVNEGLVWQGTPELSAGEAP